MGKAYQGIVDHYESRLAKHGDSHLGVDWPDPVDADTRYSVHLGVITAAAVDRPVQLLDLGCGASHLYGYMLRHGIEGVAYSGSDISERFIELSRAKYPHIPYYCVDILEEPASLPQFDYVVMNGVLTQKRDLSYDTMLDYATRLIRAAFQHADVGLAFNVMSTHADWERDDLFQLPLETLAALLTREVSGDFVIRHDYGLDEYTTYVYR